MFPHPPYPSNDYVHNDLELGAGAGSAPMRVLCVSGLLAGGSMWEVCTSGPTAPDWEMHRKGCEGGRRGLGVAVRVCFSGVHVCVCVSVYIPHCIIS